MMSLKKLSKITGEACVQSAPVSGNLCGHKFLAIGNITTATLNLPSGMYTVWTEEGSTRIIL